MDDIQKALVYVDSDDTLKEICCILDKCSEQDFIAVDTEFTRNRTFFPILNLIQLAFGSRVYLIDPQSGISLEPFFRSFAFTQANVLLFSAREDLETLHYEAGKFAPAKTLPCHCIDLQLLLAFLKQSYMKGLQSTIEEYLGITLNKDQTRSDWSIRPLSEEQILYACNDVAYLEDLYLKIMDAVTVEDEQRSRWFKREMQLFTAHVQEEIKPSELYKNISGAGSLSPRELNVLKILCEKRYEYAFEHDESLNRVITSRALCLIAKQPFLNFKVLDSCNMKSGAIRSHGKTVIKWFNEAQTAVCDEHIEKPYDYYGVRKQYADSYRKLKHVLSSKAAEHGLCPELLCSKSMMNNFFYCSEREQIPLLQTDWYLECIGSLSYQDFKPADS